MINNVPVILRPNFKNVRKDAKRAENAARSEAVRRSQEEANKLRLQCRELWEKFKKEEKNEEARRKKAREEELKKAEEDRKKAKEARRKEKRKRAEEARKKAEENRKKEEEARKKAREARKKASKKAREDAENKAEEERRRRARQQQQKVEPRPSNMNANTRKIFNNLKRSKDKASIRKAYLKGSLKLHPNKGGDAELFKRFKAIYNRKKM